MLPYPVEFVPFTTTRVFSITQMFIFTFMGFWLLRVLVKGYPTYTIDTDWLLRMPGMRFMRFCREPLINFGSLLDKGILKVTYSVISWVRSPILAMRMTPRAIGLGVLIVLILFSFFLMIYV